MRNSCSKALLGLLTVFFITAVRAEAPADPLFDDRVLHDIHLSLDPNDWQQLRDRYLENTWFPATFLWQGQPLRAEIRSRGGSTRNPIKPGLKVRFNPRFEGRRLLVLYNNWLDDSMIRQRLSLEFYRAAGLPAPLTAHARLFVNGEYWGLYTMIEAVDDRAFLQSRFAEDSGYLYSYEFGGQSAYGFEWRGPDPGDYLPVPFEPQVEDNPDPAGLIALMDAMNNAVDGQFTATLGQYLDLDSVLKLLAVENLTGEYDGITGEGGINNFYLYQHRGTTRFTFIPWDRDNSLFAWDDPIYKNWSANVLTRRLLTRAHWATYLSYLEQGAQEWIAAERFMGRLQAIYDQIQQAAYEDRRKPYGDDLPLSNRRFDQAVMGVRRFAEKRAEHVLGQVSAARSYEAERFKLYFPLFVLGNPTVFGAGYATSLALTNRTPVTADVTVRAYDEDGRLIAGPVVHTLGPAAQLARFERELLPFDPSGPRVGWIEVSSPVELKGFFITGDPAFAQDFDSADVSSEVARELIFMHAAADPARNVQTYYVVCNPNDRSALVRLSFTGVGRPPEVLLIPPKGLRVVRLEAPAPVDSGYMRLQSDQPVTGIQLISNAERLTVLRPVPVSAEGRDLVFPHFAVNEGFTTRISLINPTVERADVLLTALDNEHNVLGQWPSHLDPGQHLRASVSDLFSIGSSRGLMSGYLRLESGLPGLIGFTEFDYDRGRATAAIPVAPVPKRNLVFSHVVHNFPDGAGGVYSTGIALMNPSSEYAIYTYRLHDREGNKIAHKYNILGPGMKLALMLNELFDEPLPTLSGGYLEVWSRDGLYGYELFFTQRVDRLAAVPAQ